MKNNIFSTAGTYKMLLDEVKDISCKSNIYTGNYIGFPSDATAITIETSPVTVENGKIKVIDSKVLLKTGFKMFDVSAVGLLPGNVWEKQRNIISKKSRTKKD